MQNVMVVIGAGGQAIVRRVSAGKLVLLDDIRQEKADAAAKTLSDAGFNVTTTTVDVASRASVHALVEAATTLGEVFGVIHAAGVSPSQASPETILGRSIRGRASLGVIWQRHSTRGCRRRDRFSVWPSPTAALNRTERAPRNDTCRRVARSSHASTRSDKGLPLRLPNFKARELVARRG